MSAANRTSTLHEATFQAAWNLQQLGRELRLARIISGRSQSNVGRQLGCSKSQISRRERGLVKRLSFLELCRHAGAVGLKLVARLYPAVRRPLDAPQLALLKRLHARIGPLQGWRLEVPMPNPGDLRAADATIATHAGTTVVEAITRLANVQAQYRAGALKQRDLGAERLIFLVSATRANREAIRLAGPILDEYFPVRTREALRDLQAGRLPRGNALILL